LKPNILFEPINDHEIPIIGDKTIHSTENMASILYGDGHVDRSTLDAQNIKPKH
jgi:prepilin-type processing-associated H-X9-DG protein